jgi:hypothetical protein
MNDWDDSGKPNVPTKYYSAEETQEQILIQLIAIKKELAAIKTGMSGSVALGIIGASIITGLFLALMQVFFRR